MKTKARRYRLAEDESGMTHVVNRTRSLCGVAVAPADAEVTATKSMLAKLLTQLNRGCMPCMLTVTRGSNNPTDKTREA